MYLYALFYKNYTKTMFNFKYRKPIVVAEIGCNHKGDIEIAKELILLAKEAGADYAKFQKRTNKELLTPEQYAAPHPNPANAYGDTYGAHREFLEFSAAQHVDLMQYCASIGVGYATSVWDVTSAREIAALKPDYIKVPSACNNHFDMMKILRDEYAGGIHVSLGMTTSEEMEEIVRFFEETDSARTRLVIYACTSGYPVPAEDVCLLEVNRLFERFDKRVASIAFSGHHLGTAIDVAAITLGADWVERHFTKDRTWKGTDHGASLEPQDLKELCSALSTVHNALKFKPKDILDIEEVQRNKLKYRKH